MIKFFTLAILLFVLIIAAWAMANGWKKKLSQFKEEDQPQEETFEDPHDTDLGELLGAFDGVYIATVFADHPLDRISAHGLGLKNRCTLAVYQNAVVIEKKPQDVLIPMKGIRNVQLTEGMIGKVIGRDKVLSIGWRLGDTDVDTGFSVEPGRTGNNENVEEIKALIEGEAA